MGVRHDGVVTGTRAVHDRAARRRPADPLLVGGGAHVPVVARRCGRLGARRPDRAPADLAGQPAAAQATRRTATMTAAEHRSPGRADGGPDEGPKRGRSSGRYGATSAGPDADVGVPAPVGRRGRRPRRRAQPGPGGSRQRRRAVHPDPSRGACRRNHRRGPRAARPHRPAVAARRRPRRPGRLRQPPPRAARRPPRAVAPGRRPRPRLAGGLGRRHARRPVRRHARRHVPLDRARPARRSGAAGPAEHDPRRRVVARPHRHGPSSPTPGSWSARSSTGSSSRPSART